MIMTMLLRKHKPNYLEKNFTTIITMSMSATNLTIYHRHKSRNDEDNGYGWWRGKKEELMRENFRRFHDTSLNRKCVKSTISLQWYPSEQQTCRLWKKKKEAELLFGSVDHVDPDSRSINEVKVRKKLHIRNVDEFILKKNEDNEWQDFSLSRSSCMVSRFSRIRAKWMLNVWEGRECMRETRFDDAIIAKREREREGRTCNVSRVERVSRVRALKI